MEAWILLPVFLPILAGISLLISSFCDHQRQWQKKRISYDEKTRRRIHLLVISVLGISCVLALVAAWSGDRSVTLFYLMEDIPIFFCIDDISRLFVTFLSIVWMVVCIYSFKYMEHEGEEKRL